MQTAQGSQGPPASSVYVPVSRGDLNLKLLGCWYHFKQAGGCYWSANQCKYSHILADGMVVADAPVKCQGRSFAGRNRAAIEQAQLHFPGFAVMTTRPVTIAQNQPEPPASPSPSPSSVWSSACASPPSSPGSSPERPELEGFWQKMARERGPLTRAGIKRIRLMRELLRGSEPLSSLRTKDHLSYGVIGDGGRTCVSAQHETRVERPDFLMDQFAARVARIEPERPVSRFAWMFSQISARVPQLEPEKQVGRFDSIMSLPSWRQ